MDNFVVENLGPIAKAEVDFGDLTILTGPQASGKTLFLETFQLVKDDIAITDFYTHNAGGNAMDFLDYYYGDNMHTILRKDTLLELDYYNVNILSKIDNAINVLNKDHSEYKIIANHLLSDIRYIPAQRSLALSEGRIKTSDDFVNSPYVLVKFCNYLQKYVRLHSTKILKEVIQDYDFLKNAEINMRRTAGSLRLEMTVDNQTIPYMVWSTGQREFTPLLMALDAFKLKDTFDYIIIEEPEIGLHPRAIIEFMFTVLKLMKSGVKVVISTHSSTPLDFVWAMNHLKESNADIANIAEMFDFKIKDKSVFDGLAEKIIKVYYFSPDKKTRKVYSKDISSLDVYSEDEDVSNWGGMSLSADRAGSIVSKF